MNEHQKWEMAGKPSEEKRIRVEQQRPSKQLWKKWSHLPSVMICVAACVLCIGVCIVVLLRTSELQTRLVSLEQRQRDAQLSAWMLSLEQAEPVILGRLDQILDEVRHLNDNTMIMNPQLSSLNTFDHSSVKMIKCNSLLKHLNFKLWYKQCWIKALLQSSIL